MTRAAAQAVEEHALTALEHVTIAGPAVSVLLSAALMIIPAVTV